MRAFLVFACAVGLNLYAQSAQAAVQVNEVMANEPGANTTLEWIELFNNSAVSVNLAFYELAIGSTQIGLSGSLDSGAYMVVCRRLLAAGTTPGFESVWGNNSGTWGDAPNEQYRVIEASFSLANASGSVVLRIAGLDQPAFAWSSDGIDGHSWERKSSTTNEVLQCLDHTGSTPGFINSITPVANDVSIDTVTATSSGGSTELLITVENVGLSQVTNRSLVVFSPHGADSLNSSDTLATAVIQILDPGFKTDLPVSLNLSGVYHRVGVKLSDDGRVRNNYRFLTVPGSQFPPARLTEVLPNPQLPLTSEWVEIRNEADTSIDLDGWSLCDMVSCYPISDIPLPVKADSFIVLCQDSIGFRLVYTDLSIPVHEPATWPVLNNTSDRVALVDATGNIADDFTYQSTYNGNYTWARSDSGGIVWGRSADSGGTPGQANRVLFAPSGQRTEIMITPKAFSPDGDGFEDECEIAVSSVKASGYTMRIYDKQGRIVRRFFEDSQFLQETYSWDGRSDAGNRLPVGIYVLYFEASGIEDVKRAIVIAR
ncbi:MAG: lamin tail domain-containing protein [Candidatus Zixiibacteriota bacterium]